MKKKPIIIGSSGASGMPLLLSCLKIIRETPKYESHLIMTKSALLTLRHECGFSPEQIQSLADQWHPIENIGAKPASGSFPTAGMIIVPCSMKTLAGIHSGYSDNLLLRAADVTLKEQRPLVLAVRESPFSAIHLRNMADLAALPGVRICPPMFTYYQKPETIKEMTEQIAARLLEPFGLEIKDCQKWKGMENEDNTRNLYGTSVNRQNRSADQAI